MRISTLAGALTITAAVLLAGCSGGEVEVTTTEDKADGGPGGVSGARLCELVPQELVQDLLEDDIAAVDAKVSGSGEVATALCLYRTQGGLATYAVQSTLTVSKFADDRAAQERLDMMFEDLDDKPLKFERIDGLGDAAGFGPTAHEGYHQFSVIFPMDGSESGVLKVYTGVQYQGTPTAADLRPIAERIVQGLERAE